MRHVARFGWPREWTLAFVIVFLIAIVLSIAELPRPTGEGDFVIRAKARCTAMGGAFVRDRSRHIVECYRRDSSRRLFTEAFIPPG